MTPTPADLREAKAMWTRAFKGGGIEEIASLLAANREAREADMFARKMLWLHHGHRAVLYGDDGEMQCSRCRLDYKRDSWERIQKSYDDQAFAALSRLGSREGE